MLAGAAVAIPGQAALAVAATSDPASIGRSADTAAGSCWEVKQVNPSAASGSYWLLTPAMTEPQQFYCDQTTDGGGWVLIGKGRDGWTADYDGKGKETDLTSPNLATMSAATTQLPSTRVDQLLGNAKVSSLTDGVRLRRAKDAAGTTWQESRMRFSNRDRWVWTFGAAHALKSFTFDTTTTNGGTSSSYGADSSYLRVNNIIQSAQKYHPGFAYGSGVVGTNSSTSYLWSSAAGVGGALPYTQAYLRPKITSSDAAFTTIADSGTPARKGTAVASSFADDLPWHVSGLAGNTGTEGNVEVQAFTQSGSTMYVGGNFKYVRKAATSTGADQVNQPFLAGFDVNTGALVQTFRPTLNEQVRSLATLPNGDVLAAGDFSQANGRPATAVVALNPTTGATDTSWKLTVENRLTGGVLQVHDVAVRGNDVFLGGAFTHLTGGSAGGTVFSRSMAQVSAVDGTPRSDWNPNLNGTVNAVDPATDGARVYAAGFFDTSNGAPAFRAAAVQTVAGAPLATPSWTPTWSTTNKTYQRAIDQVGDNVVVGGSEHSLFTFSTSTFNRITGHIMMDKGDIQDITSDKGVLYAGCHCNQFNYSNSYTWPSLSAGWTQADAIGWFGAYDAATGATIPSFTPDMTMRLGSGVWAIKVDTNGRVWAGGDMVTAATKAKASAWAGGFTRFAPADVTPPTTPTGLKQSSATTTSVTLSWAGSTDNSGSVHYQVLRDDRVVDTTSNKTLTVPKGGNNRFFVRAADASGNVSASTRVLSLGTSGTPPSASFTTSTTRNQLTVDASGSSATGGSISSYRWDFGDGGVAAGVTTSHAFPAAGTYIVTLTVTDSGGLTTTSSSAVTVAAPPTNAAPADAYGRAVYDSSPTFYYRLGEQSGTVAKDAGPDALDGAYSGSYTLGTPGALAGNTDTAVTMSSSNSGLVVDPFSVDSPSTYSEEIWFKTSTNRGGKLIGFGSRTSGTSDHYDRHIYMQDDGRLVFGAYTGNTVTVTTASPYNDNVWHCVVATQSPSDGMKLYVDGQLKGSDPNGVAENYTGYWRIGGDTTWGSSSAYFDGALDEAAVYDSALSPTAVADHYQRGTAGAATNAAPKASFTSSVTNLDVAFDAGASNDSDGSISSYAWDFGDGTQGTGRTPAHTYAASGSYTVTLTVRDNGNLTDTTTAKVDVTAAPAPPVEDVVVAKGGNWNWRYAAGAPPTDWNSRTFDASNWNNGAAALGFGSTGLGTDIDTFATTSDRPRASYFTKSFQVSNSSKVTKLVLDTVADDGVVVYVNGVEVGRSNMPTGDITYLTFAPSARNTTTANSNPLVFDVPTSLLVDGTNTVAAETHLNYRGTRDMSFDLKATLTRNQ